MADQSRESDVMRGFTEEEAKMHAEALRSASTPKGSRLSIAVDVDVSDALTGLKALRREADAAVRSLKALDQALGNVSLRHTRVGDYEETEIFRPEVSE